MAGGPDYVSIQPGAARHLWPQYAGKAALVIQAGCFTADDRIRQLIATPEDAVRYGADALAVAIPVRGDTEGEYIRWLTDTVNAAARFEMPVIAHVYPARLLRGGGGKIVFTPDQIAYAVRIGFETGVDVIKVGYTGDFELVPGDGGDLPGAGRHRRRAEDRYAARRAAADGRGPARRRRGRGRRAEPLGSWRHDQGGARVQGGDPRRHGAGGGARGGGRLRVTHALEVLGFGAVAVDDIIYVDRPLSAGKGKVIDRIIDHGGNVATALVAVAQARRARRASSAGSSDRSLADPSARELERQGVDMSLAPRRADARPIRSVITVAPDGERFIAYDDEVPHGTSEALADATLAQAQVLLVDGYATHSLEVVARARALGLAVVADVEWTVGAATDRLMALGGSPGAADRLRADLYRGEQTPRRSCTGSGRRTAPPWC